jgi:uncharacterized glyoxalase superfamily protein PhnB
MTTAFKPKGYQSVSPYLMVNGAEKTIAFLEQAFGAKEIRRFPDDKGRIRHAEVRLDDTVIMLADAMPDYPSIPNQVHVYVPDVDATYKRAIAVGATSVQTPVKKGDADKRGGVKDAGGTTWWIATKID